MRLNVAICGSRIEKAQDSITKDTTEMVSSMHETGKADYDPDLATVMGNMNTNLVPVVRIESGKEIPNELFIDGKTEGKNILTKGITTILTGLGLTILLFALVNPKIASVGLMIICIGVGQIIIHLVMKSSSRKKAEEPTGSQNVEGDRTHMHLFILYGRLEY